MGLATWLDMRDNAFMFNNFANFSHTYFGKLMLIFGKIGTENSGKMRENPCMTKMLGNDPDFLFS